MPRLQILDDKYGIWTWTLAPGDAISSGDLCKKFKGIMMRIRISAMMPVILICIFFCSFACADDAPDFRKSRWGMSPAEVKATEKDKPSYEGKPKAGKQLITYDEIISDMNAEAGFLFMDDHLVRAKYIFNDKHSNKSDYLSDFIKLSEVLKSKYGQPAKENTYWRNDLYRSEPNEWGMAVSVGHLAKFTTWETDRTIISLGLYGENYKIKLHIEYSSKEHKDLEKKSNAKSDQDKL